jgi:tetratricopeptide (TPR) repeat protein
LESLGKYKIVCKIGQGAMGEVYKAHDPVLNRDVAIKTIVADLGGDSTLRKRFEREAQSAASLNHPNIIKVYDFGDQDNKLYMAMELLEGIDLRQAIDRRTLASLDERLDVMHQICEGLSFAHAHDIVHRDLKPANIHILPSGRVRIMDFGLARLSGSEMTRTGMVMGTPHYMSPEQVRGERADTRSDVFAVGCVFYELLTHHKAFEADSMHAVLYKVMQENPRPIRDFPGIPLVIAQVVERTLVKNPEERLQNAGELTAALQRAREALAAGRGEQALSLPPPPAQRPSIASAPAPPAGRPAEGPRPEGQASRPATVPRHPAARPALPAPTRSRGLVYGAVAFVGVVALAGLVSLLRRAPAPPQPAASSTAASGQVENLARAVADTQVELARKRLEAGDYPEALRQAERALKLDPNSAEASEIKRNARKAVDDVEAALAAARSSTESGDAEASATALWRLLQVAPDHSLVAELMPRFESTFKNRAEEARRSMAAARKTSEAAGAGQLPVFGEANGLVRDGEKALQARRFATAARAFLKAQERFERAQRSIR